MQLPGLSENEQLIVATVARCYKKRLPRKHPEYALLNRDEREIVNNLTSILRVSNALDKAYPNTSGNVSIRLHKNSLIVRIPNYSTDLSEQINLNIENSLFRETFGLKVKLSGAPGNYEI